MPETPIEPALTAEQWNGAIHRGDFSYYALTEEVSDHARAALCLYGQPFGFTRDDVETLRLAATNLHHFGLVTLADRIEALLPPA